MVGLLAALATAAACSNSSGDLPDARSAQSDAHVDAVSTVDAASPSDASVPTHNCSPSTTQQLLAAFADDTCTTVTIAAGTYQGNFSVQHDVAIIGAGIGITILDGNSSGSVLQLAGSTLSSVTQMTIQNGKNDHGGGISATLPLSVTDVDFENNVATQSGGAIDMGLSTDGATLTILNGTFANNAVQGIGNNNTGQGGAIYATGVSVSIMSSTFTSNSIAVDGGAGEGGAVYLQGDATVDIENTTFTTNSISTETQNGNGGALVVDECASVTIASCQFLNNTATATTGLLNGGAIDIYAQTVTPMVTMTNDTFMGNVASGCGVSGGALAINDSSLMGSMLAFEDNQATSATLVNGANYVNGGAVAGGNDDSADVIAFSDSTFSGNSATLNASTDPTAIGMTAAGGGLNINGSLSLTNVIVSNNTITSNASAGVYGGGLNINAVIANVSIFDSSIVNNTAALAFTTTDTTFIGGGGAYISSNGTGDCQVEFANSFIAENELSEPDGQESILMGPQLDFESYGSSLLTVAFSNATILTDDGAGFPEIFDTFMGGTSSMGFEFANTILDAHNDNGGCSEWTGMSVVSGGYNLISSNCLPTPLSSDIILSEASGDPASDLSPQETTDAGFPYYAITFGSPAFNGGNPAGCSDAEGNLLTTDALGQPRFGNCDIGAYEVQPLPP